VSGKVASYPIKAHFCIDLRLETIQTRFAEFAALPELMLHSHVAGDFEAQFLVDGISSKSACDKAYNMLVSRLGFDWKPCRLRIVSVQVVEA